MVPLKGDSIRGSWATLLLPVEPDQSFNYQLLSEQIDILIAMEVSGIYSNGTASEFYAQTEDEFDKISSLLADKCNAANMPFQIGCNHMSPQISLDRLRRATSLKPSAIQVILPDWYPPTFEESAEFLHVMAEAAAPIGLVLYNPPHAKVRFQPADYGKLHDAGVSLAGCKTAGGDDAWYGEMRTAYPGLSVFVPGHRLATGISNGAHGAYSNIAALHPRIARQWYETMLTDMPKAMEIEGRIADFMSKHIIPYITAKKYSNTAVDKFLAAVGGWSNISTRVRWPYRSIPEEEVTKVRTVCRTILPEFFEI